MSDIAGSIIPITQEIIITNTVYGGNYTYTHMPIYGDGGSIVFLYLQRIYDTGLNQYVYYKLANVNNQPNSSQTKPNHTGLANLLPSSHEIIYKISELA